MNVTSPRRGRGHRAGTVGLRGECGFTLVEMMIVVVILGILASVSYPIYTRFRVSTMQGQAQNALLACAQGMERYAGATFSYAGADVDGGDDGTISPNICQNFAPDTGEQMYTINVEVTDGGASYELQAVPVDDTLMDGDGTYCYLSDGTRGKDANDDGDCIDGGAEDGWGG